MNQKQKLLRKVYPVFMKFSRFIGMHANHKKSPGNIEPPVSVFQYEIQLINGRKLTLEEWKGMYIMIVNTASYCGYTAQFAGLEMLYQKYAGNLVIIAFPSNDFDGQEPASDAEIAAFCDLNYKTTFPMAKKTAVLPGIGQHPLFEWLTKPALNGWNEHVPAWNFSKYLIDPRGRLVHFYESSISPTAKEVVKYLD